MDTAPFPRRFISTPPSSPRLTGNSCSLESWALWNSFAQPALLPSLPSGPALPGASSLTLPLGELPLGLVVGKQLGTEADRRLAGSSSYKCGGLPPLPHPSHLYIIPPPFLSPPPDVPGCASMYLHTEGFPGPSPGDGTIGKTAPSSLPILLGQKKESCHGGGCLARSPSGLWGLSSELSGLSDPPLPPQGYGYEKPVRQFPDDVCIVPEKFEGQRSDYS